MPTNPPPKRRDFFKAAAAGAAGAMGIGALRFDKLFAQTSDVGWVNGMQINPAIDNLRVICCHDTKMLTSNPATSFTAQNAAVDANLVSSNLDQMAMLLANKTVAADAWSTIFRSSKPWASTKVAIKVNAILGVNGNHPRVAVVKKIVDVFVDQFKVPAANIVIYDATSDASGCYATYCSLTDATKIRGVCSVGAQSLGGMVPVTIAASTKSMQGVANLVNGTIDILVDIAIVKRHSGPGTAYAYGSCSLCMKNHLGTFNNAGTGTPSATGLHNVDAICNLVKHPAVVGGNPVRQQLCIVAGLLANGNGAGGSFDTRVDRLIMGTFAPAVDYLTAMRIMKDVMNKPDANNNVPKFLTNFGYAETDPLQWVEYVPGSAPPIGGNTGSTGGTTSTGGMTSTGGTPSTGGTTAAGGRAGRGGATATGGTPSASGTTATGGTPRTGGTTAGGTSATGGSSSVATGGTPATGGTTSSGGSPTGGSPTSAATGGMSSAATSAPSPSGGSMMTGGTSAAYGTTVSPVGGGTASPGTTAGTHVGTSGGGCSVAGVDRRASRWGAILAFGAVVAEKLRRLARSDDQSS